MCGEEHAGHSRVGAPPYLPHPQHGRLLDDLVVVRVDPESAGVQRRIDGLLHDVNPTGPPCSEPAKTDEWNDCEATRSGGNGGARRDRTDDLKLAKLALSQLSYGPIGNRWHRPTQSGQTKVGRTDAGRPGQI